MQSVGRTEDWHPAAHNPFVLLEGAVAGIKLGHNKGFLVLCLRGNEVVMG